MRAEIVSVGTELLLGQIIDTNAARISRELAALGIAVYRRVTVGDNHDRLLAALREALAGNDLVITIGGLGPTMDDITRDVLAEAIGDTLRFDEGIAGHLRAFFRSRNVPILESNLRQAWVPEHGRALPNPNGTAPGLLFEHDGRTGIALPGPPGEFVPMMRDHVLPCLRERTGGRGAIRSRVLRVCGLGESAVEDRVKDLLCGENPTVAPYAKTGEVHLRVTARADDPAEADRLVEDRVAELCRRLGDLVYAYDDELLEAVVVRLLSERGLTVAAAESCTGGLLSARLTDVPGSSRVFPGSLVTYANAAKTDLAGVDAALIEKHGAVSAEVAAAMASGARQRFAADLGIGITGVAGPGGGTEARPVGLVYVALSAADGMAVERNQFLGERADVRRRSTQVALVMVRDRLLHQGTPAATDG